MKTIQLFNGRANEVQDAEMQKVGPEFHATFTDGHFIKFPSEIDGQPVTLDQLREMIARHNEHNKPAVTAEMLEQQQAEADEFLAQL